MIRIPHDKRQKEEPSKRMVLLFGGDGGIRLHFFFPCVRREKEIEVSTSF